MVRNMRCESLFRWVLPCLLWFGCAEAAEYLFPCLETPPVLDGVIQEKEWEKSAVITGFISLTDGTPPAEEGIVRGGWDEENLYLACRFRQPSSLPLRRTIRQNDGPVYLDDSVEIYLDGRNGKDLSAMTQFESKEYRHLIVNSLNVRYDAISRGSDWNGEWKSAVKQDADGWTVEYAIPWRDLGWDRVPEELGLAVGWNDSRAGNFSWPADAYHAPSRFATIRLKRAPGLRLLGVTEKSPGEFILRAGLSAPGNGRLEIRLDPAAKVVASGELSEQVAEIPLPRLPEQTSNQRIHYRVPGIAEGEFVLACHSGITVKVEKYFVKRQAYAAISFRAFADLAGKVLELRLHGPGGETLTARRQTLRDDENQLLSFPLDNLSIGEWRAEALVLDGKEVVYRGEDVFSVNPAPEWLNSTAGISEDVVLPPWTPIEVTGSGWNVWGREYGNSGSLFPGVITTRNRELLRRPVVLRLWADGEELQPDERKLEAENTPARVRLKGGCRYGDFQLTGTSVFDYDGVWFSEVKIEPLNAAAAEKKVSLTMDIPMTAEMARSLYTFVGNWSENRFHPLPKEGEEAGYSFTPYWWAGNEEGGLAWFTESSQYYHPAQAPDVLQIVHRGDEMLIRVRIISDGRIEQAKTFSFGFQATPVVEAQRDAWDDRVERFGHTNLEKKRGGDPTPAEWSLASVPQAGELSFDLNPAFDPAAPCTPLNQNLLNLQNDPNNRFFGFWSPSEKRLKILVLEEGKLVAVLVAPPETVSRGLWRQLTLSWGESVKLSIDGKVVAENPYRGFPGSGGKPALRMGGWNSDWQIDNLSLRANDSNAFLIQEDFNSDRTFESSAASCPRVAGRDGEGIGLSRLYDAPRSELDQWVENGAKAVVFHEDWTPVEDGFEAKSPKELRQTIAAINQSGLQALLYFGFQMSSINPWFSDFKNESLVAPENGGYKRSEPAQYARMVCYHSVWQNYLVWAARHVMEQYGAGGLYLDATGYVWPCSNQEHQCGYVDENGNRQPTWPFMAVRRLMRRLYTEIRSRNPDGMIDFHCSTSFLMPGNGWTTSNWVGEEYSVYPRTKDFHFTDITTLENLRMSLAWRHFGIPTDFLCYENHPFTFDEALALSLPHDAPVRPESMTTKLRIAELARQRRRFRSQPGAVWYPYWKEAPLLAGLPEEVKASSWLVPGKAALIYITNFGKKEETVQPVLREAVSGFSAEIGSFSLKPMGYRIIELYAQPNTENK